MKGIGIGIQIHPHGNCYKQAIKNQTGYEESIDGLLDIIELT